MRHFIICLVLVTVACVSNKEHELLHEAADIHMKAVKIEEEIRNDIKDVISRRNQISVQGRELTREETDFVKKVDEIEESYTWWKDNHVEVEGHDHGDGQGHDHDHSHGPQLEVTPEDMIIIQNEFLDSIESIQRRIKFLN